MAISTNAQFSDTILDGINSNIADNANTIANLQARIIALEAELAEPLTQIVSYDLTITATQGYSGSTTRTLQSIPGYTFIGFTDPYCQRNCSCSIKSVDGQTITIEGFNAGGGNPKVHFSAIYLKDQEV